MSVAPMLIGSIIFCSKFLKSQDTSVHHRVNKYVVIDCVDVPPVLEESVERVDKALLSDYFSRANAPPEVSDVADADSQKSPPRVQSRERAKSAT